MGQARVVKTICLLVVFLFYGVFAVLPQAQASTGIIEKFPTETTEIVAGWNNPTEAYVRDYSDAYAEINGSVQDYYGFGFSFNESVIFEKIFLRFYCTIYPWLNYPDSYNNIYLWATIGNSTNYFNDYNVMSSQIWIWDGESFSTVNPTNEPYLPLTIDVTSYLNSSTLLNDVHVKLTSQLAIDYQGYDGVDAFSIMVIYSTAAGTGETDSFANGFIFGSFLLGIIAFVTILLYTKH